MLPSRGSQKVHYVGTADACPKFYHRVTHKWWLAKDMQHCNAYEWLLPPLNVALVYCTTGYNRHATLERRLPVNLPSGGSRKVCGIMLLPLKFTFGWLTEGLPGGPFLHDLRSKRKDCDKVASEAPKLKQKQKQIHKQKQKQEQKQKWEQKQNTTQYTGLKKITHPTHGRKKRSQI